MSGGVKKVAAVIMSVPSLQIHLITHFSPSFCFKGLAIKNKIRPTSRRGHLRVPGENRAFNFSWVENCITVIEFGFFSLSRWQNILRYQFLFSSTLLVSFQIIILSTFVVFERANLVSHSTHGTFFSFAKLKHFVRFSFSNRFFCRSTGWN